MVDIVQLVRAPDCGSGCRGFESHYPPQKIVEADCFYYFFYLYITFGFKDSILGVWNFLQDSIVFLVAALPIIIPLGVISYLAYRVARRKIKRTKK